MRGIILAGGQASRLLPVSMSVNKHLLPIYDKPLVYYPLATMMQAGVRDILLITTPEACQSFQKLLGDGSRYGISITYAIQEKPAGIAQALLIGEEFLEGLPCALILGDNIFYGSMESGLLSAAETAEAGLASVFAVPVPDPKRFGVVELDENNQAISLEEKPLHPKSRYAVTGLYFYSGDAPALARQLSPSSRGELEITDLNRLYLEQRRLNVQMPGKNVTWMDAGTVDSMLAASLFVKEFEKENHVCPAALEEIAFSNNWISWDMLMDAAVQYRSAPYGWYLQQVAEHWRIAV